MLHALALLSLYLGWKATPLTVTVSVALGYCYVAYLVPWRSPIPARLVLFAVTCCVLAGVMLFLQRLVLRRLGELAGSA